VKNLDRVAQEDRRGPHTGRAAPRLVPARLWRRSSSRGVVVFAEGRPVSAMGFTVANGKMNAIDALVAPERLSRLDVEILDD
jgi:hypothetical protein